MSREKSISCSNHWNTSNLSQNFWTESTSNSPYSNKLPHNAFHQSLQIFTKIKYRKLIAKIDLQLVATAAVLLWMEYQLKIHVMNDGPLLGPDFLWPGWKHTHTTLLELPTWLYQWNWRSAVLERDRQIWMGCWVGTKI